MDSYMFPRLTLRDLLDRLVGATIFSCQCRIPYARNGFPANLSNDLGRELGGVVALSSYQAFWVYSGAAFVSSSCCLGVCIASISQTSSLAPLCYHIGHVVGMGTKGEVIWPHTKPVIAGMKNGQTRRNLSISERPCKAVGSERFLLSPFSVADLPVSGLTLTASRPEPTMAEVACMLRDRAVLIDVRQKSLLKRGMLSDFWHVDMSRSGCLANRMPCGALWHDSAMLGDPVLHVLRLISNEEMAWSHARRVIALVANQESVRDGSVRKYPIVAMGLDPNASVVPKASVSTMATFRHPLPASSKMAPARRKWSVFVHREPKAFFRNDVCLELSQIPTDATLPVVPVAKTFRPNRPSAWFKRANQTISSAQGKSLPKSDSFSEGISSYPERVKIFVTPVTANRDLIPRGIAA